MARSGRWKRFAEGEGVLGDRFVDQGGDRQAANKLGDRRPRIKLLQRALAGTADHHQVGFLFSRRFGHFGGHAAHLDVDAHLHAQLEEPLGPVDEPDVGGFLQADRFIFLIAHPAAHGDLLTFDDIHEDDVLQAGFPQTEQGLDGVEAQFFKLGDKQDFFDHRRFPASAKGRKKKSLSNGFPDRCCQHVRIHRLLEVDLRLRHIPPSEFRQRML